MFEIYKRHTPMFVTSDVRQVAELMTRVLGLDPLTLREFGVEISPIFQTVRINEHNEFIARSKSNFEAVREILERDLALQKLRSFQADSASLVRKLIGSVVDELGVDSFLCINESKSSQGFEKVLGPATNDSKKPLIVFNDGSSPFQIKEPKWLGLDHPAIWLDSKSFPDMRGTEAFFSIGPTLKMEMSLNRFQHLESFGSFAVGMVRF